MKITLYVLLVLVLTQSCELDNRSGDFKLLPHPQEWKIGGNSELRVTDLKYHFNASGLSLPPGSDFLSSASSTDKKDKAQLVYTINPNLDLKEEGYFMNIWF